MHRLQDTSRCPRCNTGPGTQNLLTSMTRYYVCGACDFRWHTSRAVEIIEAKPAVKPFPQRVHSGTAQSRPGPYIGYMQLDYKKAILATLWVLCSGAVGLVAGVSSPGGLIVLASLSLLPALAMLLLWHEPERSLAESIHEAKR
jgi:hypothetical protein